MCNLYIQDAVNNVNEETYCGVKVQGNRINILRFASNIAIIGKSEDVYKRQVLDELEDILDLWVKTRLEKAL